MNPKRRLYRTAAAASFGLSGLHVVMIFIGAPAYRFFDAGEQMAQAAENGSPLPALSTLGVASGLAGFGVYALAGARDIARLPLQAIALPVIAGIFLLRGAALFIEIILLFTRGYSLKSMGFSVVSLAVGALYGGALLASSEPISNETHNA